MTAQILVVDDVPANVKLLEAKLASEYYSVITAKDGFEAIEMTKTHKPDLILLDVMMPGMDGFEACRFIKENPEVSHIPVVMVTALSEKADRIKGLEAGADDFITKPINDTQLFARVRSLVRIKVLLDELRLRDRTSLDMGIARGRDNSFIADVTGARALLIDDDTVQGKQTVAKLSEIYVVEWLEEPDNAVATAKSGNFDAIIVSTLLSDTDGLRLASQIRGQEEVRTVPIIMLVDEDDTNIMLKALEMGFNDYMTVPIDKNEMAVRVRTQVRRKKYQDMLRDQYQQSVSMALTDALTGLFNRRYLSTHLENMTRKALQDGKSISVMMMDMDHFKSVNDTYGHDVGDMVLKQLAAMIMQTARSTDLAARFGGEEFVVLMPETDRSAVMIAANRMLERIESTPFIIGADGQTISRTVSIGVATISPGDTADSLLKRADEALYEAKNGGRNQVRWR